MSALAAWRDGIRRVNRAPAILIGVWALTLLVSVPLTLALRAMLAQHLGASLAADTAASGVNYDWMQEFSDQATGLGTTFKPTIIGFGAVLDNLSALCRQHAAARRHRRRRGASISCCGFSWPAASSIATPAIARRARTGSSPASGVFFFRFLRLAAVQWIVYAVLFGALHPWLFDTLFPRFTREMTVERNAFAVRVALYLVFGVAGGRRHHGLRLRQGAGGGRGPAQHAERDRRRGRFHPPQRRRGGRCCFC